MSLLDCKLVLFNLHRTIVSMNCRSCLTSQKRIRILKYFERMPMEYDSPLTEFNLRLSEKKKLLNIYIWKMIIDNNK